MTDTVTSQNIDLSSQDILYIYIFIIPLFFVYLKMLTVTQPIRAE